jgi:hypothetical protein
VLSSIIIAIVSLLGVLISGYMAYLQSVTPLQLSIAATQTAENFRTAMALTQNQIATPTGATTATKVFTNTPTPKTPIHVTTAIGTPNIQDLQVQVAQLETHVAKLEQTQMAATQPAANPTFTNLDNRLSAIEQTILENPAKAIEVVLMKKDFDALKTSYESDRDNTQKDIERVYNLMLWLIGLTISTMVGLGGLAISNIIARKPEDRTEDSDRPMRSRRQVSQTLEKTVNEPSQSLQSNKTEPSQPQPPKQEEQ